ncbi:hypothetical protein AADG42_15945 [Ammonicoccus fulvus]|uniref:Uncharacterized protein n=1 Tax=Ammonicoccus fulvus TaxID=3138240 RepID=A0ABZ3FV85_9ACTN
MFLRWTTKIAAATAAIILPLSALGTPDAFAAPVSGPADVDVAVAAAPPPADLREAVERDLGLTWDDYVEQATQAEQAAALDEQLSDTPGYEGVSLEGSEVVVAGTGSEVESAANNEGVRAEAPTQSLDAESIAAAYAEHVDAESTGLLGIGWAGEGWLVTVIDPSTPGLLADGSEGVSPKEFADANPGLTVRQAELPTPNADILGGQGWGSSTRMPRCSIGFAAFAGDGRQAMLTAGHCTDGGSITEARWERDSAYSLGRLAFFQFGTPQNTASPQSAPGADLAAYAGAHGDLRAGQDSYAGISRITGTTAPVVGAPVCMSGRTTQRWQCARIETVGSFAVRGPGGSADIRWIRGFSTPMVTLAGDSGAGMVTGLKAVGLVSAGADTARGPYSYGTSLDAALSRGYSLEVWLNQPSAARAAGGRVRGRVPVDDSLPPGTTVHVGASSAPVAADGSFDLAAPGGPAPLVVRSGHSGSAAVWYDPRYGSATSDRFCGLRGGGCIQRFTGGTVYWTPATGEHMVLGRIFDRWGTIGYENGFLGYPTSGEMCGLRGAGCWQTFQGGRMYWSLASDAHPVIGAIGEAWNRTGYENGTLGYPTSGEFCGLVGGGCFQRYQGGSFYWSPASGAQWVRGAIRDYWGTQGWERGRLGYPLTGESCATSGGTYTCVQRFQGGLVTWTAAGGARG